MLRPLYLCAALILTLVPAAAGQDRGAGVRAPSPAPGQRVALVIGNGGYRASPLKNPVKDARDVTRALRELGFEVIHKEDLGRDNMKRAIREFGARISDGSVGLFYYAGHAVQVGAVNYLLPLGAEMAGEEEVDYEAVEVGFVLAQMARARNGMNVVILDSCRNNPFARSFRSASRGLALMDAPTGTLIAYATAPGSVASDGDGANGLYTEELLRAIRTPGLKIEDVFKRVRAAIRKKSDGRQVPWETSSLEGDFYFSPLGAGQPNGAPAEAPAPAPAASIDGVWAEEESYHRGQGFYEFSPGGVVKHRSSPRSVATVISNKTWYQKGNTLVVRWFDYSTMDKDEVTVFEGVINGSEIAGTERNLKTGRTGAWKLLRVLR